jgi:hypothetical protein
VNDITLALYRGRRPRQSARRRGYRELDVNIAEAAAAAAAVQLQVPRLRSRSTLRFSGDKPAAADMTVSSCLSVSAIIT